MALANGVLVHGPTSWACAVRTDGGELKLASSRKRVLSDRFTSPLLRGPARLAEAFALLPSMKRALPEAQLPFARGRVVGAMLGSALLVQIVRRSQLGNAGKELLGSLLSVAPAVLSLREGAVAAYHGAEHIAIGSYEHGSRRAKEHERCGSHLVGPLLVTATVGNVIAARAPAHYRAAARVTSAFGAIAASVEVFAWMQRRPDHPLARALARPGHEFQHRLATAEPTSEQLEVAEAALHACLELETRTA
jgi:uncharacterized protein YqhQ